jgi:hypothetical protein
MTNNVRSSILSLEPAIKRRAAYSLAAGAAACAAATSAEAAVNYSGPQNINLGLGFSQPLDLDLDSDTDLILKNYINLGGNYQGATVNFYPGKLVGFSANTLAYVSALSVFDPIDASTLGSSFFGSMAYGANNPSAEFNNVTNAFIGLSFPNGPETHYAWVRVDVNNSAGTFLIKDWAYSSTTLTTLVAGSLAGDLGGIQAGDTGDGFVPEPGTLGMLAAGAAGLVGLRRRRRSAA